MRSEHLKGWLAEARKKEREEAVTEQTTSTEGTMAAPNRKGREETEERRGKTPEEVYNW